MIYAISPYARRIVSLSVGRPLLVIFGLAVLCTPALARPEYARKEGKPCQYCHRYDAPGSVNPDTKVRATTERNQRGTYYETHNHTFEGYSELSVMGAKSPPVFHLLWQETMADDARRLGVGDVAGDGKPRLVVLSAKTGTPAAGTLSIRKWDGTAFVSEFSSDVQAAPDQLAVGKYAGPDKPAVIVTADGLWYRKGVTFAHLPAPKPLIVLGTARLKDGTERVLIADTPTSVRAWRVSPGGANWLVDPIDAPSSSQVTWADMHASPDFLSQMGMPYFLTSGSVVGLWDARKFGTVFLYYVRVMQDFDVSADPNNPKSVKPKVTYKNQASLVAFRDPTIKGGGEIWRTQPFNGQIYDVAVENARGSGVTGLLILTSETPSGKGHGLYFYALD
jgi:hypothetical protein